MDRRRRNTLEWHYHIVQGHELDVLAETYGVADRNKNKGRCII